MSATTQDLLITTIDLTRACCANGNYLSWLARHGKALHGSAGIANYLANAAVAFEEQAHPQLPAQFDAFDARDNLTDILMASVPPHVRGIAGRRRRRDPGCVVLV